MSILLTLVMSCNKVSSPLLESEGLIKANGKVTSLQGLMIFENFNTFNSYIQEMKKKKSEDRKKTESLHNFTSLISTLEQVGLSGMDKSNSPLFVKKDNQYELSTGGLLYGLAANELGFYIIDDYMTRVGNTFTASIRLKSITSQEITNGMDLLMKFSKGNKIDNVISSPIPDQSFTSKNSKNARLSVGSRQFESERRVNFSVRGKIRFQSYFQHGIQYCDGNYFYDPDYQGMSCDGQIVMGDYRRESYVILEVQSMIAGEPEPEQGYNFTESVGFSAALDLYHPGESPATYYFQAGGSGTNITRMYYFPHNYNFSPTPSELGGSMSIYNNFNIGTNAIFTNNATEFL
ncbi:MAG: hypothetical protein EAZ32_03640 [Cytophagia bacterium]|nr:MAG: hypothetical protein EAZ38_06435 [Cytophagales bacterium]TAG41211.1 MAG: hypothetical protein EAZ32_03640 [Cytophagia bacterium]TAG82896.1 MAG: hypothetical protein EAZ22_04010 [Cytophagales bacterium]